MIRRLARLLATLALMAGPALAGSSLPPGLSPALLGVNPGVEARTAATLLRRAAAVAINNNPQVNPAMTTPPAITVAGYCAASTAYVVGETCYQSPSFYTVTAAGTTSSTGANTVLVGNGASITYGGATFAWASAFPTANYSNSPQEVGSCTCSISGFVMTVTAMGAGDIKVGTRISGGTSLGGTVVTATANENSTLTGTGGTGTYLVSYTQTVASSTLTLTTLGNFFGWNAAADARRGVFDLLGGVPTTDGGTSYVKMMSGTVNGTLTPFVQRVHFACDCRTMVIRRFDTNPTSSLVGSMTAGSNQLTVTSATATLAQGFKVSGPGLPPYLYMQKFVSGTNGGAGVYQMNAAPAANVGSETMQVGGGSYRLIVNGQFASFTPVTNVKSAWGYLIVTFPTRAVRDIKLESIATSAFGGVDVLATESVSNPVILPQVKMAVTGDSQAACGDCGSAANAYPNVMADFLGVDNVSNGAIGGCGMLISCPSGTALSRLSDVTNFAPDIVLDENGGNDCASPSTTAQITAAKLAYLTALRAALPNALIFVSGLHPIRTFGLGVTACETAMFAAVTAMNDKAIIAVPDATSAYPYFAGTSTGSVPQGDGNLDIYVSPSADGHDNEGGWGFLGRRQGIDMLQVLRGF